MSKIVGSPVHTLWLNMHLLSLPSGFPRQAGTWVEIGGVRSSFSMPDVVSVALGGGTLVEQKEDGIVVGPESVGHRLTSEALVFGGDTMTTTGTIHAVFLALICTY